MASAFPGPGFTEHGVHTQYGTKYGVVSSHNNKFGGDFDFHSRTTTTLPPLLPLLLLRPYYYFMLPPEREKGKNFFQLITFAQKAICVCFIPCLLFSEKINPRFLSPQFQLNSSEDCFPFTTSLFRQRHPPFYSFSSIIFNSQISNTKEIFALLTPTAE